MALVLSTEYIDPVELTGYVRAALADLPQNAFGLSAYLPNVLTDDIDFRASVGQGGLARAASFRAFDAESPISGRKGINRLSGSLPPISEKRILGEYDRLKLRNLADGIKSSIFDDAVDLAKAIHTRIEIARGQLLMTGKVTIAENKLALEADFGRAAGHTVTAGTLWGTGGDPVADLLAWQAVYVATNGVRPGAIVTSQNVVSALMRNQKIRDYTLPAGSTVQIVTVDAINALLMSFGLPALSVYEAQYANDAGSATSILDPKKLMFLPPAGSKIGETLWGVTAEAMDSDYAIDSTEAPGIVVGSYSDKDPVALWTKASAIALPIAPNTNLTLAATVLA